MISIDGALKGILKMVKIASEGKCPFCGNIVNETEFSDDLSYTEYTVSGLCQGCQDKTFD